MKTRLFNHQHKYHTPPRLVYFSLVISKDKAEHLGDHEGELMSPEEIKDIRDIVQNARRNIVVARLRVQTLVGRKESLEKSLMSFNGHQKDNQEELAKVEAELELVKKKIEELEESIASLKKEIEALEDQLTLLDKKLAKLDELHASSVNSHGILTNMLADHQKQINKLEDQLVGVKTSRKLMASVQKLDIDLLADRSFQTRHFEIEDGLAKIERELELELRKLREKWSYLDRRLGSAAGHLNNIVLHQELSKVEQAHVAGRKGVKEGDKAGKDAELVAKGAEAQKLGEDVEKLNVKIRERAEKIRKKVKEIADNLQERKLKVRHVELKMDSLGQVEDAIGPARASIETHMLGKGKEKILLKRSVLEALEESLKGTYEKFLDALLSHVDVPEETKRAARNLKLNIIKRDPVTHKEKPIASMKYLLKDSEKISGLYDDAISSLGPDQQASKDALTVIKRRIDMKNPKSLTALLELKFEKAREEGDLVEVPALSKAEKKSLGEDKAQLDKDYVLALLDLFLLHSNLPIVRDDLNFKRNKLSGTLTLNGVKETFKLRVNKEKNILEIARNPVNIDRIQPREYKTVTSEHELVRAIREENQRIITSENPDKDRTTIYFSFTKN